MKVDTRIVSERVCPDVYPIRIRVAGLDRVCKVQVPVEVFGIPNQARLTAVFGAVPEPER